MWRIVVWGGPIRLIRWSCCNTWATGNFGRTKKCDKSSTNGLPEFLVEAKFTSWIWILLFLVQKYQISLKNCPQLQNRFFKVFPTSYIFLFSIFWSVSLYLFISVFPIILVHSVEVPGNSSHLHLVAPNSCDIWVTRPLDLDHVSPLRYTLLKQNAHELISHRQTIFR